MSRTLKYVTRFAFSNYTFDFFVANIYFYLKMAVKVARVVRPNLFGLFSPCSNGGITSSIGSASVIHLVPPLPPSSLLFPPPPAPSSPLPLPPPPSPPLPPDPLRVRSVGQCQEVIMRSVPLPNHLGGGGGEGIPERRIPVARYQACCRCVNNNKVSKTSVLQ